MKIKILFISLTLSIASTLSAQDIGKIEKFDGVQDSTIRVPYAQMDKDRFVGAATTVTSEQLSNSSRNSVNMALVGLVPGLTITEGLSEIGIDAATMRVRGLSRGNDADGPLIVIDGMSNRSLDDVAIEEIESIEVLKDAAAKLLYGSAAANGVIMVTTKRGEGKPTYKATFETGLQFSTADPQYLGAYDYVRLHDQAHKNDNIPSIYTPDDILGYKDGLNYDRYPDVDFYDTFLKNYSQYYRANAQMQGAVKGTSYFLNVGYYGENGLEAVGEANKFTRLNVRSNIDHKINNFLSAFVDLSARWDLTKSPAMDNDTFFETLSSDKPSDYPLFVEGEFGNLDKLGMGYTQTGEGHNLYGELTRKGYREGTETLTQVSFGLDGDFNQYVKGLTAKLFVAYDNYNLVTTGKDYTYSLRQLQEDGTYKNVGTNNFEGDEKRFDDDTYLNLGIVGQLNYDRTWGLHEFTTNAVYNLQQRAIKYDGSANSQDDKSVDIGIRANYTYDRRYVLDVSGIYLGSDKFTKSNRWKPFGAVGAGWIISNEQFMEDADFIDYLKLKGSYGKLGYDNGYPYYNGETYYTNKGSFKPGFQGGSYNEAGYAISQTGNQAFTFEVSTEINVGVEARFLKNRLSFEANYFDEKRDGIPTELKSSMPGYYGYDAAVPLINYNAVHNRGAELQMMWRDNLGDFKYQVGGHISYAKSTYTKLDELNRYENLNQEGGATDGILMWQSDGLYQNQNEIDQHGVTSAFGTIIPGDVKLLDITPDGVINNDDRVYVGHNYPRINYGVTINLEWKNLSLFVLGQGVADCDRMLSNDYFQINGNNKYSEYALNAATLDPATGSIQPGASYPRLTTIDKAHSYRSSNFWMTSGAYFKVRNVHLAYSLPQKISSKIKAANVKVFFKGDNLCTISSSDVNNLDPENLNAGITGSPLFRTFSLGLSLNY